MLFASSNVLAGGAAQDALPDSEEKELLMSACQGCHGMETVLATGKSREDWATTIHDMVSRGAQIFPDEVDLLADYLAEHRGPDSAAP